MTDQERLQQFIGGLVLENMALRGQLERCEQELQTLSQRVQAVEEKVD